MNTTFSFRAIKQGQTQQSHLVKTGAGQNGEALVVRAAEGTRYQLSDLISLTAPKKLQVKRVGQDLFLALPGNDVTSPDIIIKDYFSFSDLSISGMAASGETVLYDISSSFNFGQVASGITPESVATNKTTAITLNAESGNWFDGVWGLAALGGGGLLLAAASGGGEEDTTVNAGLTQITTFKGDATKAVPTVSAFATAGVSGVDASNITGILSFFTRTQLPLDSADSLQTLVNSFKKIVAEANGTSPDSTTEDPSSTDYVNLMGSNTPNSITEKPQALALLNNRLKALNTTDVNTYSQLKALADVVEVIAALAQTAPSTSGTGAAGITAAQLTSMGVDVSATSLTAVSDAIRASPDDLSGLNSTAKLKALVTAYNTILSEANGTAADATTANPSSADYAAVGADIGLAKTDTSALARLNVMVGNLAITSVDTVEEITKLAATLDKIQTVAALATSTPLSDAQKFSADELKNLGLTGFTSSEANNAALALAVSNTIRDGVATDVQAGDFVNGKLDQAGSQITWSQTQLERLQTLVSLEIIKSYVLNTTDSTKTTPAPTVVDWTNVGVFSTRTDGSGKFDVLSPTQVGYLNTAVDALAATSVNTTSKLQAIADAYARIYQEANGSTADASPSINPTVTDLALVGVTGAAAASGEAANLLLGIIANRSSADVDTLTELQSLADTAAKIMQAAADSSVSFTAAELAAMGLRGASNTGTSSNLADFISQLKATNNDGTGVNSLAKVQSLLSLAVVQAWARDVNADSTASPAVVKTAAPPTAEDFKDIGVVRVEPKKSSGMAGDAVSSMSAADVSALNNAIDTLVDNSTSTTSDDALINSLSKVQAIATSYFTILNEANGTANDYTSGNIIQNTNGISTANSSIDLNINPVQADYVAIGVTGTFDDRRTSLLNTLIAEKNFAQVDTIKEIQQLASSVDKVLLIAADATYNPAHDMSLTELSTDLSLVGVNTKNLSDVLRAIQATADDKTAADTFSELQSLVSFTRIMRYADDTNTASGQSNEGGALPTFATDTSAADTHVDDWKNLIGLAGELGSNYVAYNSAADALGSSAITGITGTGTGSVQSMVTSYNKILAEANGVSDDATIGSNPLVSDYLNMGLNLSSLWSVVTPANTATALNLLNDALGGLTADKVDTYNELRDIATAVGKVMQLAEVTTTATPNTSTNTGNITGLNNVSSLTMADLSLLGLANTAKASDFSGNNSQNEAGNIYAAIQNSDALSVSFASLQKFIYDNVV